MHHNPHDGGQCGPDEKVSRRDGRVWTRGQEYRRERCPGYRGSPRRPAGHVPEAIGQGDGHSGSYGVVESLASIPVDRERSNRGVAVTGPPPHTQQPAGGPDSPQLPVRGGEMVSQQRAGLANVAQPQPALQQTNGEHVQQADWRVIHRVSAGLQ